MTDLLLAAILVTILAIVAADGIWIVWRSIDRYEKRLSRLEKIVNDGDPRVPYKIREAVLDLEAPLVHTLVQGKVDLEAYLARTQRALQIYQDLYKGIYEPKKGKK